MRHDSVYKSIFSHGIAVEHLVRGFVARSIGDGPAWVETLDFSTLERWPTEEIDEELRGQVGDALWRVRFLGGGEAEWLRLFVMLEFQSGIDWAMALRVRNYTGLLYRGLLRGRAFGARDRLPPVLPVVVYNGRSRWTAERTVEDLVAPDALPPSAKAEAGTPWFAGGRYILVDVGSYEGEDLPPGNAMSVLVGIETMRTRRDAARAVIGLFETLRGPEHRELRAVFLEWIRMLAERAGARTGILSEVDEMERLEREGEELSLVEERMLAWNDEVREEGREEGRAEIHGVLRRLAERKFGPGAGERVAAALAGADGPDRLLEVGDLIVDCRTGEDLAARLESLPSGRA